MGFCVRGGRGRGDWGIGGGTEILCSCSVERWWPFRKVKYG